jgi:hypothetical protein
MCTISHCSCALSCDSMRCLHAHTNTVQLHCTRTEPIVATPERHVSLCYRRRDIWRTSADLVLFLSFCCVHRSYLLYRDITQEPGVQAPWSSTAWSRTSYSPWQHQQQHQMQLVDYTGAPVLADNEGVTALVSGTTLYTACIVVFASDGALVSLLCVFCMWCTGAISAHRSRSHHYTALSLHLYGTDM